MTAKALLAAFDWQARWCDETAPFTARVLRASRDWLAEDAAALNVLASLADDPQAAAVPLRWVAGLHLLALQGLSPWLDLWPPNTGQAAGAGNEALAVAVRLAWQTRQPLLRDALSRPPQTNEAQRSAALLPGLLHIAAATGRPLALLEIGASAGLNLWCDRYRLVPVTHPAWAWGDAAAPLMFRPAWNGPAPWAAGAPPALDVRHRAACDAHPVDLRQPGEALRLASFIWPEQTERLSRLRLAQKAVAGWMADEGVQVQAMSAARFVQQQLQTAQPGVATVLMHSVVWQYIDSAEQQAIIDAMNQASRQATAAAPLAWLRFEPEGVQGDVELRCRIWPDGGDTLLARCHPHAREITWLQRA